MGEKLAVSIELGPRAKHAAFFIVPLPDPPHKGEGKIRPLLPDAKFRKDAVQKVGVDVAAGDGVQVIDSRF